MSNDLLDYFNYLKEVVGISEIILEKNQDSAATKNIIVAIQDYANYTASEQELLSKMLEALKIDMNFFVKIDITECNHTDFLFKIEFLDQPNQKNSEPNQITTFSPRTLLKKPELKKNVWADLQKVIAYFSVN